MVNNMGKGPFGEETSLGNLLPGDVIQLGNENGDFYHTVILTGIRINNFRKNFFVCAHTEDAYQRNLFSYNFNRLRCIHIIDARK